MTQPDWEKLTQIVKEMGHPDSHYLQPGELERLVTLWGWEVFGIYIEAHKQERQLRALVAAGMPFDEAAKCALGVKHKDDVWVRPEEWK